MVGEIHSGTLTTTPESGSMGGATGSGQPNAMSLMGMNMNTMNAIGNVSSMIPNVPRTGGPTTAMNMNYDVLQSFVQRSNSGRQAFFLRSIGRGFLVYRIIFLYD